MASKTKKIAALLLTAMMAATAMAGCGGDDDGGTVSVVSQVSEDLKIIDFNSQEVVDYIKAEMKKEAADGEIKIRLWCAGDDRAFEKTLVDKFTEKFSQDGAKINITIVSKGEDEAGGKIIEAPNKGADVFSFADDQLSLLTQNGAIAKVATYYKGNVLDENSDESITVSTLADSLYAFPKTCDNGYFLYYDKRVLKEEDVASFDGMIEKAAAQGKSVYFNMGNAWYNTGFFFTAGCTITYEGGKQTATFDSPEGLKAAQAMRHICEKQDKGFEGSPGQIGDNAYVTQGFDDGKLAAAVIGTWEGPAIKKAIGEENVGAAKLPTVLMDGEQKQLDSFGGYKLIGVNVYAKAGFTAQTLAYYLGCEQSQIERYENRGLIPTNKKAAESDKIKKDPAFKAIEDQRPSSHPQGTTVSGVYWKCGIGSVGGDIDNAKGNIDDATLQAKLKACEENCK